jgi:hypothetical protein
MVREQRFDAIRENDYGQELHFYLTNLDGSAYSIPGDATVTFEAYLEDATSLTVNDTAHVTTPTQTGDDIGHCYYTIQSADFDGTSAGTYWCRMKVNTITSGEAKLPVKDEYSNGE